MHSHLLTLTYSSAHSMHVHAQPSPHTHLLIRASHARHAQPAPHTHLIIRASHACQCTAISSHSPTHPRIPCPPCTASSSHSLNHPRIPCLSMHSHLLTLTYSSAHPMPAMHSQLLTLTYSSAHSMPVHAQPSPHTHLLIRAFHACPCTAISSHSPTHPRIPCPPCTASSSHSLNHPRIPCLSMHSHLLTLTYSSAHPMPAMHSQLLTLTYSSVHPPLTLLDRHVPPVHMALAIPPHDKMEWTSRGQFVKASPAQKNFSSIAINPAGKGSPWYGRCLVLFHYNKGGELRRGAYVDYYTEDKRQCPSTGCKRLLPTEGDDNYAVIDVDCILSLVHIVPSCEDDEVSLLNRFV
ncbi:unnamed protein product, partial [Closterium sp. NIES-54]